MLAKMRDSVHAGSGRVVIAVVLPFKPFVEDGAARRKPTERIQLKGKFIEEDVNDLVCTYLFASSGRCYTTSCVAGTPPAVHNSLQGFPNYTQVETVFMRLGFRVEAFCRAPFVISLASCLQNDSRAVPEAVLPCAV